MLVMRHLRRVGRADAAGSGRMPQGPSMYEMEGPCFWPRPSVWLVARPCSRCAPTAGARNPCEAPAARSSVRSRVSPGGPVSNGRAIVTACLGVAQGSTVVHFQVFLCPHNVHRKQAVMRRLRPFSTSYSPLIHRLLGIKRQGAVTANAECTCRRVMSGTEVLELTDPRWAEFVAGQPAATLFHHPDGALWLPICCPGRPIGPPRRCYLALRIRSIGWEQSR
jgi:hypothetical protein